MKLGNKGSISLRAEVLYIALFALLLLVAIFFIYVFAGKLKNSPFNNNLEGPTYKEMENDLVEAAVKYVEDYYDVTEDIVDTTTVKISNLVIENLVSQPKDEKNGASCTGYVLVKKIENGTLEGNAFLKCANYTTRGYQEWRME